MKKIHRIGLAVLSGLLFTIAWPSRGFAPFVFIALIPLLFLENKIAKGEKAHVFWLAFLAFLVWNVGTTWWVWNATPAAIAAWVLNGFFMTVVFWLFHVTKKAICPNRWGNFILIPYWMAYELFTYHWVGKWPWLNLGNVFSTVHNWVQWYEFTGVAGGTLWVLLVNILLGNAFIAALGRDKKVSYRNSIASGFAILLPLCLSFVMYNNYEEKGEDVEVIVVQQNCDPWNEQFDANQYRETLQRNISLAEPLLTDETRFVVSSESAIQEGIWWDDPESPWSVRCFRQFAHAHPQTAYVIGATTMEWVPEGQENDFAARSIPNSSHSYYTHNSALLIDTLDMQHRNKSQLTPGVEAVPEWEFLKKSSLTVGIARGTLKTDSVATNMHFANHEIGVPICYESAFGGYVRQFTQKGADLLFVITNDGWWGDTPGYKQHFEFSKLRAIENRRCVARSANTGKSGFFNQKGDVLQQTSYWVPDAIRETLKANTKITFYARHGDYLFKGALIISILLLLALVIKSIVNGFRKS